MESEAGQTRRCCVPGCSTIRTGENGEAKISMHRIPKATPKMRPKKRQSVESRRTEWMAAVGVNETELNRINSFICSKHFISTAYTIKEVPLPDGRIRRLRILNDCAVPTLNIKANGEADINDQNGEIEENYETNGQASNEELVSPNSVEDQEDFSDEVSQDYDENALSQDEVLVPVMAPVNEADVVAQEESESFDVEQHNRDVAETVELLNKATVEQSNSQPSSSKHDTSDELSNSDMPVELKIPETEEKVEEPPKEPEIVVITEHTENSAGSIHNEDTNSRAVKRKMEELPSSSLAPPRKKVIEEVKTHARMKISPTKSQLGLVEPKHFNEPPGTVVAGSQNKYLFINEYSERLFNEAVQRLRAVGETQSDFYGKLFNQASSAATLLEEKFKELNCRQNSCKSTYYKHVCTEVGGSLRGPSLNSIDNISPSKPNFVQRNRGRPLNARLQLSPPLLQRNPVQSNADVIDLTDDSPSPAIGPRVYRPRVPQVTAFGSSSNPNSFPVGPILQSTNNFPRPHPLNSIRNPGPPLQHPVPQVNHQLPRIPKLPPGTEFRPVNKNHTSPVIEGPSSNDPSSSSRSMKAIRARHPAPLPPTPEHPDNNRDPRPPPAPVLEVRVKNNDIVLTWDMHYERGYKFTPPKAFHVFTYTEKQVPPSTDLWMDLGPVEAVQLPMAVTLSQFVSGFKYHFAVRAKDKLDRYGPFSEPKPLDLRPSIVL